jgi:serine O-acetyltransferase
VGYFLSISRTIEATNMLGEFKLDVDRYVYMGVDSWLYVLLTKQGLWALAEYRFSRWVYLKVHVLLVRQVLKFFSTVWHMLIQITTGISLPKYAKIGSGLYIGHFGGIIIHPEVEIGEYCNLSHSVTIGIGGRGEKSGVPKIGNRVFIGPGARIFGPIEIGNDVAIGANSVVTKDVPDRAVVMGIPAQIVSFNGSQGYVSYRGELDRQVEDSRSGKTAATVVEKDE